jgi:prevent-host-death family protein
VGRVRCVSQRPTSCLCKSTRAYAKYHGGMKGQTEIGARDLRDQLADVLNNTAVYGRITYVTSRGRRVAAIVPVPIADQAVAEPAEREAA